jgi:hypothetical protein
MMDSLLEDTCKRVIELEGLLRWSLYKPAVAVFLSV